MEQRIIHALQARAQGYNYTRLELTNWLCTQFDITLAQSKRYVDSFFDIG
jgi:hypothetical protein